MMDCISGCQTLSPSEREREREREILFLVDYIRGREGAHGFGRAAHEESW